MPEFQLLRLLIGSLRARLARAPREAGAMTVELVAIAMMLVVIAGVVFLILRSKVEQGATRITLP